MEKKSVINTNTIDTLARMSNRELANRYFKKLTPNQENLDDQFNFIVNKTMDKNLNRQKYNIILYTGLVNMQYIYDQISGLEAVVNGIGCQFKMENLINDINESLKDNALDLAKAKNANPNVVFAVVQEIINKFVNDIITNKALVAVAEKNANSNNI